MDGTGPGPIDAVKNLPHGRAIVCEWETGNISSSHRALNKLVMALKEDNIEAGVLVVPDDDLYPWLTDRIGNIRELRPYFRVWSESPVAGGMLSVYVVGQDDNDEKVPLIEKGTDGRALI